MAKDALEALQRHFEAQYGKLSFPDARKKKRKRESSNRQEFQTHVDGEDEWHGIEDEGDNVRSTFSPQVVSFIETSRTQEEESAASYKSFMVFLFFISLLY